MRVAPLSRAGGNDGVRRSCAVCWASHATLGSHLRPPRRIKKELASAVGERKNASPRKNSTDAAALVERLANGTRDQGIYFLDAVCKEMRR